MKPKNENTSKKMFTHNLSECTLYNVHANYITSAMNKINGIDDEYIRFCFFYLIEKMRSFKEQCYKRHFELGWDDIWYEWKCIIWVFRNWTHTERTFITHKIQNFLTHSIHSNEFVVGTRATNKNASSFCSIKFVFLGRPYL